MLLFCSLNALAQLKVAPIFANNMVLQQKEENYIWGEAKAKESITLSTSWLEEEIKVKADKNGRWKVAFSVPQADLKSHTITIKGKETITLQNVLFGEVWLCSGQSNMQMSLGGNYNQPIKGGNEAIANSTNKYIRHCTIKREKSTVEQSNCKAKWEESNPNTSPNFTAAGYFFAQQMYQTLGVPIGLVNATWGGTRIEAWMDKEILSTQYPSVELPETEAKDLSHNTPTILYNTMIHPIVGLKIKGVLWYQGESNIKLNPIEYYDIFPSMITRWRELWQQGDFPFYYVQIASFNYPKELPAYLIRDAQLQTLKKVENVGMATITDVGEKWNIHPMYKKEVGERLAYLALNKTYGFHNIQCTGPIYKSYEVVDNKIVIEFDNVPRGLTSFGVPIQEMYIAGQDSVFVPAQTRFTRNRQLEVFHKDIKKPLAVRYCWNNAFVGNLFCIGGIPASPFRTDNWKENNKKNETPQK
ncbi:sialate O-acetylesterase [Flammeovirga pacifica]|nr:sialate O-acetylesterase [Flammeovirga pacifica]